MFWAVKKLIYSLHYYVIPTPTKLLHYFLTYLNHIKIRCVQMLSYIIGSRRFYNRILPGPEKLFSRYRLQSISTVFHYVLHIPPHATGLRKAYCHYAKVQQWRATLLAGDLMRKSDQWSSPTVTRSVSLKWRSSCIRRNARHANFNAFNGIGSLRNAFTPGRTSHTLCVLVE